MAALGLLFVCYLTDASAVQAGIHSFLGSYDRQVTSGFLLLIPYVAIALCVAGVYVLLKSLGFGKSKREAAPLAEQLSVQDFTQLAVVEGVGVRVAHETYRMLLPTYGDKLRAVLHVPFADLDAAPEFVWRMFEELVDRSSGTIRGQFGIEALVTPMQMMQAAEQCVVQAVLERRAVIQKTTVLKFKVQDRSRTVMSMSASGRR